jgi:hypothetical protein
MPSERFKYGLIAKQEKTNLNNLINTEDQGFLSLKDSSCVEDAEETVDISIIKRDPCKYLFKHNTN